MWLTLVVPVNALRTPAIPRGAWLAAGLGAFFLALAVAACPGDAALALAGPATCKVSAP